MEAPQGNEVVSVPRQIIDVFFPKVKAPHLVDVFLCGVTGIGIAGRAGIQGNVELSAAHGHVRIVVDVFDASDAVQSDDFS